MAKKPIQTPPPRYRVVGIEAPGMVDVYPYGEVSLYYASDITLEELYKLGCEYVVPVSAPTPEVGGE